MWGLSLLMTREPFWKWVRPLCFLCLKGRLTTTFLSVISSFPCRSFRFQTIRRDSYRNELSSFLAVFWYIYVSGDIFSLDCIQEEKSLYFTANDGCHKLIDSSVLTCRFIYNTCQKCWCTTSPSNTAMPWDFSVKVCLASLCNPLQLAKFIQL